MKDLHTGTTLLKGKASEGVYEWPLSASKPFASAFSSIKLSLSQWHSRLGHPNLQTLRTMLAKLSLPCSSLVSSSLFCNSCSINKSHKLPFSTSTLTSTYPLQFLFLDVWTSPVTSIDGYKYYVIFVDHYTRYTWLYPLKTKSQVAQIFPTFKSLLENRFNTKIMTLFSDNGGEYLALRQFLASHEISHLTSPPHTPEHNGMAERKHRHIVETWLSLLTHAQIPNAYWTYSFAVVVYLINCLVTPNLADACPYQLLFHEEPNYSKLRTFGCFCYPWVKPYGQHKFTPKLKPCVFMGYSLTQSAYICLDVQTSRVYISRHVTFVESVFPFSRLSSQTQSSPSSNTTSSDYVSASLVPIFPQTPVLATLPCPTPSPEQATLPTPQTQHYDMEPTNVEATSSTAPTTNAHPMTRRSKNNIRKPNPKYGLHTILQEVEPNTFTTALKDEKWRKFMSTEYDAFARNKTFDLVDRALATNIVGSKWVYRIKRNPDGSVDKYKSRLVAKGFHQRPRVDFHDTFSPVIKHATIRLVLGTAVASNWPLQQLDVNNAFLQGPLEEEVYMLQPPGFVDKDHPDHVCRLNKAVYGLKQAPRAWYTALKDFLVSIGFKKSLADESLFVQHLGTSFVYMLIYVDDIIITGTSMAAITRVIDLLAAKFSLKDLGELSYFLGMEATRTSDGLHLTQMKYIIDLLRKTKISDAKPVATPMSSGQVLTLSSGDIISDLSTYRATVGSLQYLSLTRPDIAFAVNRLSQYMHQPRTLHWEAVKRVLRYLVGTANLGIFFSAKSPFNLRAYSDADWADNRDDYTSTGAYITYLGHQPVSWSSKKQTGVARSSTEAEYRALTAAATEVKWLTSLMSELGLKSKDIPVLYCDNIGATYLSANPVFHSRMKHLALDYHFVREQVQDKALRVAHICSADQLVDALTKPLPRARFLELSSKIGLCNRRPS